MHIFEVIILGLVQGLTEFLPISSSAHLRIVGEFLPSQTDPGATFTAITQIGTELAVLIYFRKKIGRVISRWFRSLTGKVPRNDPDARMGWLIIIGTIPIAGVQSAFEIAPHGDAHSLQLYSGVLTLFTALS